MYFAKSRFLKVIGAALCTICVFAVGQTFADDGRAANQIDYSTYFLADIRDAEECAMLYSKGKAIFPDKVSNPAITCPDMFSWKLFVESVNERFWSNWADETQNWPSEPYQLCSEGGKPGVSCCQPGALNNPAGHCPVFPADQHKPKLKQLDYAKGAAALSMADDNDLIRIGLPSIMEHAQTVSIDLKNFKQQLNFKRKDSLLMPECSQEVIDNLVPQQYESIGRVIRQTNAEITVRDKTFHNYLFDNNLYNANGAMDVFRNNANNLNRSNAPYHRPNHSVGAGNKKANLARVDLPSDSIMIKSNWLHEKLAATLNIVNDPANPFIQKYLATQLTDKKTGKSCLWRGPHYLMAFHISSKDIPQWVWATFEHVKLPGRCDVTGCNDSYGYKSPDQLPPDVANNFVAPHVKSDDLNAASMVFDRDKLYAVEQRRPGLEQFFKKAGIGSGSSSSPHEPDPSDKGWLSYRLKGSQVDFTDLTGRSTLLGNSVTEAGFMDGSSCVSCHSRAGIHINAQGKPDFFKLSVFDLSLSDYGYARSVHGVPNKNWFNDSDMPPTLQVLQTDFIWGFLFAKEIVQP